ncbi:MAG TPA: hypothetical protein DEQ61_21500 [Streptomyces sp.]|nr:hypothetical protein [Streptomyces sp.]
MTERRSGESPADRRRTPRDLPDQQAGPDRTADRWDANLPVEPEPESDGAPAEELPDTDEAGTGRRGERGGPPPDTEQPVPDEPAG